VDVSLAASAGETPIQEQARRSDEKIEAARESLEADPNVKALKDMFGAELNQDSIEPLDRTEAKPTGSAKLIANEPAGSVPQRGSNSK